MAATLDQLAAIKITAINNDIDILNENITNCTTSREQAETFLATITTESPSNTILKNILNGNIANFDQQLGYLNESKTNKQSVITSINLSLTSLSQEDKDFSALVLQNYSVDTNRFDFNVKSAFVAQVKSIYDNEDLATSLKKSIIEQLCNMYDNKNY